MEEHQERAFKGIWIDAEIWLDKELTPLDKVVYAEIVSLDGDLGCIASNAYLAEFCQCGERSVTRSISKLIERGYIMVAGFDGRKRVLRACRVAKLARKGSQIGEAKKARTSYYRENSLYRARAREEGFSTFDTEEFMQANIRRGQRIAEENMKKKDL